MRNKVENKQIQIRKPELLGGKYAMMTFLQNDIDSYKFNSTFDVKCPESVSVLVMFYYVGCCTYCGISEMKSHALKIFRSWNHMKISLY